MAIDSQSKLILGYALIKKPTDDISDQIIELRDKGCLEIYQDLAPTINDERLGLNQLLSRLTYNTIIYTKSYRTIFGTINSFEKLLTILKKFDCSLFLMDNKCIIDSTNIGNYLHLWSEFNKFKKESKSMRSKHGFAVLKEKKLN